MDKTTGMVIAYAALLAWTVAATWQFAAPAQWQTWLRNPDHASEALRWSINVAVSLFALSAWVSDPQSRVAIVQMLGSFRQEATGIAIAVIVVEEVSRLRQRLEYKAEIIRQMASRSNDFALDAARVVVNKGWDKDGSLKDVRLQSANLKGADLQGAYLEGAVLGEAHLEGAVLWETHLEGAFLQFAHLEGAFLGEAHLERANLGEAHLKGANLEEAHLEGASLLGANLERANLWEAHLEGTNLLEAHLKGAVLLGANLERANLWNAHLEDAKLKDATYNAKTCWPKGFDPVAAGAIFVDDASDSPPPG